MSCLFRGSGWLLLLDLNLSKKSKKLLDKQRNILDVAGLLVPKMSASEVLKVYDTRIKSFKIVNFKTGELTDSKGDFDLNSELRSDETLYRTIT